jgi:cupin 2 domain-containing protein
MTTQASDIKTSDLFAPVAFGTDGPWAEDFFETLAAGEGIRIERIAWEGHASPDGFWYDQGEWEWGAVLQGSAELEFEWHGSISLKAGQGVFIPAHARHRVAATSTTPQSVCLAVFGVV